MAHQAWRPCAKGMLSVYHAFSSLSHNLGSNAGLIHIFAGARHMLNRILHSAGDVIAALPELVAAAEPMQAICSR